MNNIEYIEGSVYSSEAYDAVRYGFKYRKISEQQTTSEGGRLNFCIPDSSDILVFLAEVIISGVTFDLLKLCVKKAWEKLKNRISASKDNGLTNIFTNETSLHEFYTYIQEYHEKRMNISEEQAKYIKEEVMADYCGKQSSIIFSKYKRVASVEEYKIIFKDGLQKANEIIIRKK